MRGQGIAVLLVRHHLHWLYDAQHDVHPAETATHGRRHRLAGRLIGSELVPFLTTDGHKVTRLVTGKVESSEDGTTWVHWDPDAKLDPATLDGIDAVIHLAGDNVASGRWTDAKKRKILESRVGPTRTSRGGDRGAAGRPSTEGVHLRLGCRLLRQSRG